MRRTASWRDLPAGTSGLAIALNLSSPNRHSSLPGLAASLARRRAAAPGLP